MAALQERLRWAVEVDLGNPGFKQEVPFTKYIFVNEDPK
jgi:hypothetical protein